MTSLGDCLRAEAPESVAGWAAFIGHPSHWDPWAHLLHSVRSEENAFRHVHGMDGWAYRAKHPELGATYDRAMTSNSRQRTHAVLTTYDFGQFACVVDVGGGRGAFLAAILARHAQLTGVLFDLPQVVAGAGLKLEVAGVADRCRIVGGSFLDAVPAGGGAYLLGNILHDWADDQATAILRNCREVMSRAGAGRVLVIERELLPPNEGVEGKFSDLNMLVQLGGQERTTEEYAALFATAGFQLRRSIATASPWSIFEGVPA